MKTPRRALVIGYTHLITSYLDPVGRAELIGAGDFHKVWILETMQTDRHVGPIYALQEDMQPGEN